MANKAKPRVPGPPPHGFVQSAGKQEDFFGKAKELAEVLGWGGDPDWEYLDIRVEDAIAYLMQKLHEQFIAGAQHVEIPDWLPVVEHLAVDTEEERTAVVAAMKQAYEAGKGAELTMHEKRVVRTDADLTLNISGKKGK